MIHRNILHNGELKEASESSLFPGQLGLLSGWGVFSTLRVMEGELFAFERHWQRMSRDARLLNVAMPADTARVELDLVRLIEANGARECTLRLVVVRNGGGLWEGPASGQGSDTIALTADLKQWGESVRLAVQPNARYAASDFTRAKILSWAPNLRWAERAHDEGYDEVILLNEFDRVAECTSATIFAAFGNEVVTPPLSDGCLPGITREILLEEINVPGIRVKEGSLLLEELHDADEVFITSTTRSLLPVREIEGRAVNAKGDVCERLSQAFDAWLRNDIARRRHAPAAL
jgi:branched-chain amino acid aminotransferase